MSKFAGILRAVMNDESGQDLIEYALVAGLIGLGAVLAMGSLANNISSSFNNVSGALTNAT
jgi:pilus assembly protein Flp/PilA